MKHLFKIKQIIFLFSVLILIVSIFAIHGVYAKEGTVVENKVVILDPGHGGWDPGKTGEKGSDEKDINLKIAENVKFLLELGGAEVYMTRYDDSALGQNKQSDMKERMSVSENTNADVLVSIHQNAYPSANAKGAQTFFYKSSEEGRKLAQLIQKELVSLSSGENTREAKENSSYYMLKKSDTVSVIVECGFISNPEEEALLNEEEYQQKIAWAIYKGIFSYFEQQ